MAKKYFLIKRKVGSSNNDPKKYTKLKKLVQGKHLYLSKTLSPISVTIRWQI
ncbi:hypothetical protein PAUR_b0622 [Pseudoalteromonas aurantia 208]|uniref:Uncharacterized protein n=1 Tax=Pseudoalteromonas aurantia 208 TaxID=1314867 RepID=A0ABR9EHT9_9GAMM|nr:hypothetical protein [Pseudoalteromonas aurantia 208]